MDGRRMSRYSCYTVPWKHHSVLSVCWWLFGGYKRRVLEVDSSVATLRKPSTLSNRILLICLYYKTKAPKHLKSSINLYKNLEAEHVIYYHFEFSYLSVNYLSDHMFIFKGILGIKLILLFCMFIVFFKKTNITLTRQTCQNSMTRNLFVKITWFIEICRSHMRHQSN